MMTMWKKTVKEFLNYNCFKTFNSLPQFKVLKYTANGCDYNSPYKGTNESCLMIISSYGIETDMVMGKAVIPWL